MSACAAIPLYAAANPPCPRPVAPRDPRDVAAWLHAIGKGPPAFPATPFVNLPRPT